MESKRDLSLVIYLVGIIIALIAIFLPFYHYIEAYNDIIFSWKFMIFDGWIEIQGNYDFLISLPKLPLATSAAWTSIIYSPIMMIIIGWALAIKKYGLDNHDNLKSMMYVGLGIQTMILIQFMVGLISKGFFVPFMELYGNIPDYTIKKSFSIDIGAIILFVAIIILFLGTSIYIKEVDEPSEQKKAVFPFKWRKIQRNKRTDIFEDRIENRDVNNTKLKDGSSNIRKSLLSQLMHKFVKSSQPEVNIP